MSMPAIQAWKSRNPDHKLSLLVKPPLIPLWQHHNAIDEIIPLTPGNLGPIKTGPALRQKCFHQAFIFPNSWRAALPPYIARIPRRIGFAGHTRRMLLTDVITPPTSEPHQQWEYASILELPADTTLPPPQLNLPAPPKAFQAIGDKQIIAILPGAARGPAKRWPTEHFLETARILAKANDYHFVLLGTAAEASLCQKISQSFTGASSSFAGSTTLPELASILKHCTGVLSNDSGGMHLAAAVGTPVVAMFGLTNPAQTGPIGPYTTCLQPPGIQGNRRISRCSAEAESALASIRPDEAAHALQQLMHLKAQAS
jgi:heptosyltransferase-2